MWPSGDRRHRDTSAEKQNHQVEEYMPGFAEVSAFISLDKEGGLYRRFRQLSARNILYLQSEIAILEHRLEACDQADAAVTDFEERMMVNQCAVDWQILKQHSRTNDRAKERIDLITNLRPMMKTYCTSKLQNLHLLWGID